MMAIDIKEGGYGGEPRNNRASYMTANGKEDSIIMTGRFVSDVIGRTAARGKVDNPNILEEDN
jgi:hypothetical protein